MKNESERTKRYLTWDSFNEAMARMAQLLQSLDPPEPMQRLGVFGIARGGLPVAVALSHQLGIPLVQEREYADDTDSVIDLCGARCRKGILYVVDDICDSGVTFRQFVDDFEHRYNAGVYPIYASWFMRDGERAGERFVREVVTGIQVYGVEDAADRWIKFPWEAGND